MFDVRRYLSMDPWRGLVTMISDRTYIDLIPSNCELVSLESLGGLATRATISTNRGKSSAQLLKALPSELTYLYNRLDPNEFFRTSLEALNIDGLSLPISTSDILQRITEQKGIVFDAEDFEYVEFTAFGSLSLISKPESLRWVGLLDLTLVNTNNKPLSVALVNKSSPDVFRSLGATGRIMDIVYFYNHDFTQYRQDMAALIDSPNGLSKERLGQILKEVTGDNWVCKTSVEPFNFCTDVVAGAPVYQILYVGPPILTYTQRTDKRNLIVLRLNQLRSTALTGAILLHYD